MEGTTSEKYKGRRQGWGGKGFRLSHRSDTTTKWGRGRKGQVKPQITLKMWPNCGQPYKWLWGENHALGRNSLALRSPPVSPKGNQSWIFIGRTDSKAEAPILWLPDAKRWLIRKDPVAGKDWRQEEKGMTEDKMVGWHHRLNGHEFEQALGDGAGQISLACCSPWGYKELEMTLNWTESIKWEQYILHMVNMKINMYMYMEFFC